MKKIIISFIVTLLIFSVVGCTDNKAHNNKENDISTSGEEIENTLIEGVCNNPIGLPEDIARLHIKDKVVNYYCDQKAKILYVNLVTKRDRFYVYNYYISKYGIKDEDGNLIEISNKLMCGTVDTNVNTYRVLMREKNFDYKNGELAFQLLFERK